jgi:hypothetical protein
MLKYTCPGATELKNIFLALVRWVEITGVEGCRLSTAVTIKLVLTARILQSSY